MFDVPQMVKSLTIVMKAPMPWGYFGLNDVSLLSSGDESFMLVSGRSSSEGEHCLIASGLELGSAACLDAVAAGDGREVFAFRGELLMHTASSLCVAVVSAESERVALQNCRSRQSLVNGTAALPAIRIVDADGAYSNVGLVQVRTSSDGSSGFGTVCGMNLV